MGLLKPAMNQTAAAKIGIYGEAGSGKTRTATEIAIGLALEAKVPIAFFDTEGGSDFMVRLCRDRGVELLVARARAFADLMAFMKEAREAKAVAIIDSISHTWDDLRESYERKLKRKQGLEIWDWGVIKPAWREFTTEFLVSPVHAIVCGRAASIYEQVYNEERGKKEVQVVGSKMKTEKETAYEPSLLIEMERRERRDGAGYDHLAHVMKDRSDQLDGQTFPNPTYKTFLPFFKELNIGGTHAPTDPTRTSDHLFATPDNAIERKRSVEITLEKIRDAFILADIGTQATADKKRMKELLTECFGSSAWSEVEGMRLEQLQAGLTSLRRSLGQEATPISDEELEAIYNRANKWERGEIITNEERRNLTGAVVDGQWDLVRKLVEEYDLRATKAMLNGKAKTATVPLSEPEPDTLPF